MKLDELVSFRVGRNHAVAFGLLTEIDLSTGECVVMRNGVAYRRSLKRVKPASMGWKSKRAKQVLAQRRGM